MIKLNMKRFASGEILLSLQHPSSSVTFQGKIVWSSTTSNVTAKLYARKQGSSTATSGSKWSGYITIDGTQNTYSTGSLSIKNDWVLVSTSTKNNISHNNDGTKSITIAGSVKGPSGTSLADITSSGSGTATMDRIYRRSSLTAVNVNITTISGNTTVTVTATGTKYISSYTDTLTLTANNQTITLDNITFGEAKTLTDTQKTTLWSMFGNNYNVSINCYTTTKSGGTTIGSSNVISTVVNLPDHSITWGCSYYDSVNTYDKYKVNNWDFIRNLSSPTFDFSASSSTGDWYGSYPSFSVVFGSGDNATTYDNVGNQLIIAPEDTYRLSSPVSYSASYRGVPSGSQTPPIYIVPYEKPYVSIPGARRETPTSKNIVITFTVKYYDGYNLKQSELASDVVITTTYKVGETGDVVNIPQSSLISTSHTVTDHYVSDRYTVTVDTGSVTDYRYATYVTIGLTDLIGIASAIVPLTVPQGLPLWYGYTTSSRDQHMVCYGALNVKNNLMVDKTIFANTFEFGNSKDHILPDGDLLSGSYWCSIPNGHYWIGTSGTYTNSPVQYGFVDKTGFYTDAGTVADYNVIIYSAVDGPIYRLYNNNNSTNTWRRVDGGATEMTLALSSNQTVSQTGAVKINLSSSTVVGTGLSVSSNGIKIGAGIKYVEVSGIMQFSAYSGTGLRRAMIYKNSTNVAQCNLRPSGTYECAIIAPKLISVAKNDVIYLYLNSDSDSQTVYGSTASTYLTVKVVR